MTKNYALDFKKAIVREMVLKGKTITVMSRETGIHVSTLANWRNRYRRVVEAESIQAKVKPFAG